MIRINTIETEIQRAVKADFISKVEKMRNTVAQIKNHPISKNLAAIALQADQANIQVKFKKLRFISK
jgi:hypothetical protein